MFLMSRLISRQVTSSVYAGEKVSDFTQPIRSAAGNVDQFLLIPHVCALRSRDSLSICHWAFGQMQPRLRRGSLRLHPSMGRHRLRRHGSDAPRRQLDKTRCRVQKRRNGNN